MCFAACMPQRRHVASQQRHAPCHGAFATCPSTLSPSTNRNRFCPFPPFPHFGPVFLGTGAAAMSGRFSAPPPPRKRPSRPFLSLYLDFPLMSPLTLAACDHFPLSRPPLQVRARARRTASTAAATTTTTAAEVSVGMGVCVRVLLARARGRRRRRRRAWVSGTHGILCLRTSSRLVVGAPRLCVCVSFDPTPLSSSSSVLLFRSVVRSRFGSRDRGQSASSLLCPLSPHRHALAMRPPQKVRPLVY